MVGPDEDCAVIEEQILPQLPPEAQAAISERLLAPQAGDLNFADARVTLQLALAKAAVKGLQPQHLAWPSLAAAIALLAATDQRRLEARARCGFSHRELYWSIEADMYNPHCGGVTGARRFGRCLPCAIGKPGKCGAGSAAWFCRRRLAALDTSGMAPPLKGGALLLEGVTLLPSRSAGYVMARGLDASGKPQGPSRKTVGPPPGPQDDDRVSLFDRSTWSGARLGGSVGAEEDKSETFVVQARALLDGIRDLPPAEQWREVTDACTKRYVGCLKRLAGKDSRKRKLAQQGQEPPPLVEAELAVTELKRWPDFAFLLASQETDDTLPAADVEVSACFLNDGTRAAAAEMQPSAFGMPAWHQRPHAKVVRSRGGSSRRESSPMLRSRSQTLQRAASATAAAKPDSSPQALPSVPARRQRSTSSRQPRRLKPADFCGGASASDVKAEPSGSGQRGPAAAAASGEALSGSGSLNTRWASGALSGALPDSSVSAALGLLPPPRARRASTADSLSGRRLQSCEVDGAVLCGGGGSGGGSSGGSCATDLRAWQPPGVGSGTFTLGSGPAASCAAAYGCHPTLIAHSYSASYGFNAGFGPPPELQHQNSSLPHWASGGSSGGGGGGNLGFGDSSASQVHFMGMCTPVCPPGVPPQVCCPDAFQRYQQLHAPLPPPLQQQQQQRQPFGCSGRMSLTTLSAPPAMLAAFTDGPEQAADGDGSRPCLSDGPPACGPGGDFLRAASIPASRPVGAIWTTPLSKLPPARLAAAGGSDDFAGFLDPMADFDELLTAAAGGSAAGPTASQPAGSCAADPSGQHGSGYILPQADVKPLILSPAAESAATSTPRRAVSRGDSLRALLRQNSLGKLFSQESLAASAASVAAAAAVAAVDGGSGGAWPNQDTLSPHFDTVGGLHPLAGLRSSDWSWAVAEDNTAAMRDLLVGELLPPAS